MFKEIGIPGERLEQVYNGLTLRAVEQGYIRSELIMGALAVAGVQTLGYSPEPEQMEAFLRDMSGYVALYWATDGVGVSH